MERYVFTLPACQEPQTIEVIVEKEGFIRVEVQYGFCVDPSQPLILEKHA